MLDMWFIMTVAGGFFQCYVERKPSISSWSEAGFHEGDFIDVIVVVSTFEDMYTNNGDVLEEAPVSLSVLDDDGFQLYSNKTLNRKSRRARFSELSQCFSAPREDCADPSADTSYEKACSGGDRRGSAPATPILGSRNMELPPSNKLVNFFSKRSFKTNPLKRTKSVTKLERKKCSIDGDSMRPNRLRTSRSHESLLSSQAMISSVDLGPSASGGETPQEVHPLHPSVLGQEHCFRLSSTSGTSYYACRTATERDRWVHSLRRTISPDADHLRRTENSLRMWILEVKNVPVKKRYFVELYLDKKLYARTSSKPKGDICFWGEQFEFEHLPDIHSVTIQLYREADKKKRKDKNILLGMVTIPIHTVNSRYLIEKWYTVHTEKSSGSKEPPALRVKCRYQSIDVLPLDHYRDFLEYLERNSGSLCEMLEPMISLRAKEDVATCLVSLMQCQGRAQSFLADLVLLDILRVDDEHLTFRGNSLATKAMEGYMKLVGERYLQQTLREVIGVLIQGQALLQDCEVDPLKVSSQQCLQRNQSALFQAVEMVWNRILNSYAFFPVELRDCFATLRLRLSAHGKEELSDHLLSASIFLRFLCPAILSPSLFNLSQEYPDERASRKLTLIAKTLQTLANFTHFQSKESFMEFLNPFLEREAPAMRTFLKQISSPLSKDTRCPEFDGFIDLGKHLSLLHTLLSECIPKISSKLNELSVYEGDVEQLKGILDRISAVLNQPNMNLLRQISTPGFQSLQRNIFRYNDPTVHRERSPGPGTPRATSELNNNHNPPGSPMGRSATLPRSTYLLGGGKKVAKDLNTNDDYVLFSALENTNASFHHSKANGVLHGHHHHHHHHKPVRRGNGSAGDEYLNVVQYIDEANENGNSSGDVEPGNTRGSQLSISQLSNMASSGYQSFAYESSSPVDPGVNHGDGIMVNGHGQYVLRDQPSYAHRSALAFNNPMYHMGNKGSPSSSLSSTHSVEELRIPRPSPAVLQQLSTSSEESGSLDTPPRERRFKSFAPRTNPRVGIQRSPRVGLTHFPPQTQPPAVPELPRRRQKLAKRVSTECISGEGIPRSRINASNGWDEDSDDSGENRRKLSNGAGFASRNAHHLSSDPKSLDDYEHEIADLRVQMEGLQSKLSAAEHRMTRSPDEPGEWRSNTYGHLTTTPLNVANRISLDSERDVQLKQIISRLLSVEEELRREQHEMASMINEKQQVIKAQEQKIHALDAANSRLLAMLTHLKDRYLLHASRTNGMITASTPSPTGSNGNMSGGSSGTDAPSSPNGNSNGDLHASSSDCYTFPDMAQLSELKSSLC
ncbi:unnamed protein product [Darwinula stevensoni]|uniref:Ras GTPase-activating protein n=1 Tax=Darwinula stevensoni TaxID=69355 RepID=A0A7R8ZZ88_9CRUS|nr:unnamed protein product [Darwinula stevensoni]CAG0878488.1 unnamed protein product [Darwinula stevensoni]